MGKTITNVLFLCTGNSARSILAESILNQAGAGRFRGYSAGSFPAGRVNPYALDLLRQWGYPTDSLRSKSWEEFARPDAPPLDFIVTVCHNAAGETCPIWPGKPATAHWGIADPAATEGSGAEIGAAFATAFEKLQKRIERFIELPLDRLDSQTLRQRLAEIGQLDSSPLPQGS